MWWVGDVVLVLVRSDAAVQRDTSHQSIEEHPLYKSRGSTREQS